MPSNVLARLPQNHSGKPSLLAAAVVLAFSGNLNAAGLPTLQEVTVSSASHDLTGFADLATEGTVTAKQLANRPLLRPAEVLETIPGMVVTQHSGDGKANQYFLRGFNLDHGSDFATHLMGMPANMVSHAHGQGYMDLNFLIPELIGSVKYRKGVYAAEDGDFATTGSARIDYLRQLDHSFVDIGLGQNNYRRVLAAGGKEFNGFNLLGALEVSGNDGPWDQPENLKKYNGVLRLTSGTAANGFSLTGMAYQADWTATEHVPERAITSGEIGRYGALSPNDGGKTHRYSLAGDWAQITRLAQEVAALRTVWGGQASQSWFLGPNWKDTEITAGLQLRHDRISKVGLYTTENRRRTGTVREDRIEESAVAALIEARTQWTGWLRTNLGLRRDQISAKSTALAGQYNMDNGGSTDAGQTSPKLGVVFGPFNLLGQTEFYANWGHGFHSNDARGATARINPQDGSTAETVPLIVKARGSELGLRAAPLLSTASLLPTVIAAPRALALTCTGP